MADPEFLNYTARYNKHFESDEEYRDRQGRYHAIDSYIRSKNAQADASGRSDALRLKHNFLSDRTEKEIEAMMGLDQNYIRTRAVEGLPYRSRNRRRDDRITSGGRSGDTDGVGIDHAALGNMGPVKS